MRAFVITALLLTIGSLAACTPAAQTQASAAETQTTAPIKYADAQAASKLLQASDKVTVLDIRTPGEYAQGHIPGAQMIDFRADNFKAQVSTLDRNAPYIVHCASGGRSTKSLETFKDLGFTNVTHLDGGFRGWQAAGLPLTPAN